MFGRKIRVMWNNYLKKLAATNEKLYGNQRLDCCNMNKKNTSQNRQQYKNRSTSNGE